MRKEGCATANLWSAVTCQGEVVVFRCCHVLDLLFMRHLLPV